MHHGAQFVLFNDNLNSHKYVCITTYQPDTKSNPNSNPNLNPTTKQHAIVNIELNMRRRIFLSTVGNNINKTIV